MYNFIQKWLQFFIKKVFIAIKIFIYSDVIRLVRTYYENASKINNSFNLIDLP